MNMTQAEALREFESKHVPLNGDENPGVRADALLVRRVWACGHPLSQAIRAAVAQDMFLDVKWRENWLMFALEVEDAD
jgi:hypothetical protein